MADDIVSSKEHQSLFERLKRFDQDGAEFWTGRDLMSVLGYAKWQRFEDAVDRAKVSCEVAGFLADDHFTASGNLVKRAQGGGSTQEDYRLSRYAAYLVAMNGDVRKPQIAAAQAYFVAKTREAEVIVPAQSDRIRELEIERDVEKMKYANNSLIGSLSAMHGAEVTLALLGKSNQILETDRPILETFNSSAKKFEGQTTKQIADYLHKRYGIRVKSGAEVSRALIRADCADLIEKFQRPVTADGVKKENLEAVYQILLSGDRQKLLGE